MNSTQTSRYSLTVNAFTLDDVKRVEKALQENKNANGKLRMDRCFGPNPADGSYLAMFSSSSLGKKGYVPNWSAKAYLKLFYGIRKDVPGVRLVLRGEPESPTANGAGTFTRIFKRVPTT